MATLSVHIWHDASGRIVAVGRFHAGKQPIRRSIPMAGDGTSVIQVDVDEETMSNLHETHRVDVNTGTLMPTR